MQQLMIIGNLCADPEIRTANLSTGQVSVCTYRVAVNRRQGNKQITDYFRVTSWRERANNDFKYLHKGNKVCVFGTVSVNVYTTKDGKPAASMELSADSVEYLTPQGNGMNVGAASVPAQTDPQTGYTQVEDDELPF